MDVLGKWRFIEALGRSAEGNLVWMSLEDYRKSDFFDPDDPFQVIDCTVDFGADGLVRMLLPMPEGASQEEIDAATAAGRIYDGMVVMDQNAWKLEDGRLMFDTKMEGEVMGEPVSPWVELPVEGDTIVLLEMYRIVRL